MHPNPERRSRRLTAACSLLAVTSAVFLAIACGDDDGSCVKLGGIWAISGCPPTSCTFTQSGCSLSGSCNDGTMVSGKVTSSGANFTVLGANVPCQGTFAAGPPPTLTGTCTNTCSFTATCGSGECASSGTPNGGGPGSQ